MLKLWRLRDVEGFRDSFILQLSMRDTGGRTARKLFEIYYTRLNIQGPSLIVAV